MKINLKTMGNKYFTGLALASLLGCSLLVSCNNDDDAEPLDEKTSGFVLHTQVQTGNDITNFIQFFDEIPSGVVDNTRGKSFRNLLLGGVTGNSVLSSNVSDNETGISQLKFDLDGEPFENLLLPTLGPPGSYRILDENTAFLNDLNDQILEKITIFDPTNMTNKGPIDLSQAWRRSDWTGARVLSTAIRGNDLFMSINGFNSETRDAHDSVVVYHVDIITNTYQGATFIERTGGNTNFNLRDNWVDESGNVWLISIAGSPGTKATIYKIPSGSTEFDQNYQFNVIDAIPGGAALLTQVYGNLEYYQNGIAYSVMSTSVPLELIEFIEANGGAAMVLNDPDLALQALAILNAASNGQLVAIDLNGQSSTVVSDIPGMSPFGSRVNVIDGKVYVTATSNELNAVYEYDPATDATTKLFDVTAGGQIAAFEKIGD